MKENNEINILTSVFPNEEYADKLTAKYNAMMQSKNSKTIIYECQENDMTYIYNVTYDKERLKEILEKLKKYSYVTVGKVQISGELTKWPATKKNIEKRIVRNMNSKDKIYPETIVHNKENGCDFVTYEYSYEKLPDLYHYLDIIVNNKSVINYTGLFGYENERLNMFYSMAHQDQLVIEKILNYIDSPQLVNHDTDTIIKVTDPDYDFKGLNELYKETLECLKFKLCEIKQNVNNHDVISGLSLQKKKTNK